MQYHKLEAAEDLQLSPGNFNVVVQGEAIRVPKAWADFINYTSIRSFEELVSNFFHWPTLQLIFCARFGWTKEDLQRGREALIAQLRGVVDDSILNPPPPPKFAFGARRPPELIEPALPDGCKQYSGQWVALGGLNDQEVLAAAVTLEKLIPKIADRELGSYTLVEVPVMW